MTLKPNMLLQQRYLTVDHVGTGGMASVWKATDTQTGRIVAVKVPLIDALKSNPLLAPMMANEARAAASLFNHSNVVAVLDVVYHAIGAYSFPCIVMEYLPGLDGNTFARTTLSRRKDHLTRSALALYAVLCAARGLQFSHENGIIHRDVKPGNLLVSERGTVKVTDFGLAKFAAEPTRAVTAKGYGTMLYFAPEQLAGEPATRATDIYQLGCTLFELIEGRAPREDAADKLAKGLVSSARETPEPSKLKGLTTTERAEVINLYRSLMHDNPRKRCSPRTCVNTIAKILFGTAWEINFLIKAPLPPTFAALLRRITRLARFTPEQLNKVPAGTTLPPLRYEDREEAMQEALALLVAGASKYIYLTRSAAVHLPPLPRADST